MCQTWPLPLFGALIYCWPYAVKELGLDPDGLVLFFYCGLFMHPSSFSSSITIRDLDDGITKLPGSQPGNQCGSKLPL